MGISVAVNKGENKFEKMTTLTIDEQPDQVLRMLMKELKIPIPLFQHRRYLSLEYEENQELVVDALDHNGESIGELMSIDMIAPTEFTIEFHRHFADEPIVTFEMDEEFFEKEIKNQKGEKILEMVYDSKTG